MGNNQHIGDLYTNDFQIYIFHWNLLIPDVYISLPVELVYPLLHKKLP